MARHRSARPGVLLGALPRPVDRVGARAEERRAPAFLVLLGGRRHDAAGVRDLPARPRVYPRPSRRALRLREEPLLHLPPPRTPPPRLTSPPHTGGRTESGRPRLSRPTIHLG